MAIELDHNFVVPGLGLIAIDDMVLVTDTGDLVSDQDPQRFSSNLGYSAPAAFAPASLPNTAPCISPPALKLL